MVRCSPSSVPERSDFEAWAESCVDAEAETGTEDRSSGRRLVEEVPALDSAVSRETVALLDEELPRSPVPASAVRGSSLFVSWAAALGSKKKSTGRRPAPLLRRAAPISARPADRPLFFAERLVEAFFWGFSGALSVCSPFFAPLAEVAAEAFLAADRSLVPRAPLFAPTFPLAPAEVEAVPCPLGDAAWLSATEEPPPLDASALDVSRETVGPFALDRPDEPDVDLPAGVRRRPAWSFVSAPASPV